MAIKNIVVCCDGTGNEHGKNNTNVVEIYALAMKTASQLAYYDPGVGTGGWAYNEESGVLRALSDQGTGAGVQKNVNDAYQYLMEVYEGPETSRIFLFGFSRGVFTVRSLAGMLHKVGLLERKAGNHLEYAAKIYNRRRNARVAASFKATFIRSAPVHFIGVWDTVESLVLNEGKRWANARLNPEIAFAYHALAIAEKRRDFQPCLWDERNRRSGQTLEQVWFAGVHSDVGAITRNGVWPTSPCTGCSARLRRREWRSTSDAWAASATGLTPTARRKSRTPGSGGFAAGTSGKSPRDPGFIATSGAVRRIR